MTLVMSMALLTVVSLVLALSLELAGSSARHANRSNQGQTAYALAEAGANNALAVLNGRYPDTTNPYPGNAGLLPLRSTVYEGGTSWWCGTLDTTLAVWTVTAYGVVANPASSSGTATTKAACGQTFELKTSDLVRKVGFSVPVYPAEPVRSASIIWQWLYAPCDATLTNSGTLSAPLYAGCNLNIQNSLTVTDRLFVTANLTFSGQGHMDARTMPAGVSQLSVGGLTRLDNTNGRIGTTTTAIGKADLIGGCVQKNNTGYPTTGNKPCTWANSSVNIAAGGQNNTTLPPPPVTPPNADWNFAYAYSYPGPRRACSTVSGTPPLFESSGSTVRDTSIDNVTIPPAIAPAAQNLTPASSYTCKTAGGELSWDATNRVLTATGSIFIDGSVMFDLGWSTNRTATYNSVGTIWSSGTMLVKNATLCAVLNGTSCNTATSGATGACATSGTWDPNKCVLILAANGNGSVAGVQSQVPNGDGIQVKSGAFQGGAFATSSVESSTTGEVDGPMITAAGTIVIGQTSVSAFPAINFLGRGAPGDNIITSAALGSPTGFSG